MRFTVNYKESLNTMICVFSWEEPNLVDSSISSGKRCKCVHKLPMPSVIWFLLDNSDSNQVKVSDLSCYPTKM